MALFGPEPSFFIYDAMANFRGQEGSVLSTSISQDSLWDFIYLIPSQRTRFTRSSHSSQFCRTQTYSDALIAAEVTEEFRDSARVHFFLIQNFKHTSDNVQIFYRQSKRRSIDSH